jgi:hypothetical protein
MTYSSFGLINSAGFKNKPASSSLDYYIPVAESNIHSFFISSNLSKITESGGRISEVQATIGSGVFSQPTALDQPANNVTTQNGYKLWDFNGESRKFISDMDFNCRTTTDNNSKTMLIVAKLDSAAGTDEKRLAGQWASPSSQWRIMNIANSGNVKLEVNTASGNRTAEGARTPTNWSAYWFVFDKSSGTPCRIFYNKEATSIGSIAISDATTPNNIVLGGESPGGLILGWLGQIAQFCYWDDIALSSAQRSEEIDKLNTFWNLSIA